MDMIQEPMDILSINYTGKLKCHWELEKLVVFYFPGGQLTQSSVDLSMVHSCSASHAKPETGSEQWIPVLQPFAGAIYLPYYT